MSDMIDFSQAHILDSPDARSWPATAAITKITVTPNNVVFEFTKKDGPDRWPDQPFGDPKDHGTIQYTVWLCLFIDGAWQAAGFIECWFGRDGVGDAPSDFARNWYYAADRWAPMTGHVIQPGEIIGFLVTAGDARNGGSTSVQERSNVVTLPAPAGDTGVFEFPQDAAIAPEPVPQPAPAPPPPPLPSPNPPPPPPPPPGDAYVFGHFVEDIDRIVAAVETIATVALHLSGVATAAGDLLRSVKK